MKIFVAKEPISFKTRMDGTAAVCRNKYERDPYSGALFVFINRKKTMIRLYIFDGQGEYLCDKRIAKGSFPHWIESDEDLSSIKPHELYILLRGGNPRVVSTPADWKKIT